MPPELRSRYSTARLALVLVLGTCLLSGCSSRRKKVKPLPFDEVPAAIERAEQDIGAGKYARPLKEMHRASVTRGLTAGQRSEIAALLERAGLARIEELRDPPKPGKLKKIVKQGLPRQIGVRAGIIGAEQYLEAKERGKAFDVIESVDELYPNHSQRREAGRIVADVGLSYAEDDGRYFFFFKYRNKAPRVLEYLVDNYPSEPRTDEAYWWLGELYSEKKRWEEAIESLEDLILWRPDSPRTVDAQARIPELRLFGLSSPEYDRHELLRAEGELVGWLERHGGHPLQPDVERTLTDCRQRLADSDLSIARFYKKVDNPAGAILHARRALEEARSAGNEDQAGEALALLDALEVDEEGRGW